MAKPNATPRQISVWETEFAALEERLQKLEQLLTPYRAQRELVVKQYQERLSQLTEARAALASTANRAKGAALARMLHRVMVWPRKKGEKRRIMFLPWWGASGGEFHTPEQVKAFILEVATGEKAPLSFAGYGSPSMW